jgi:hypothetical protein
MAAGVAVLVLALLVALPGTASADLGHGWHVRCGDDKHGFGYGWFDSKGFNVRCSTVRRVAEHYTFETGGDRRFNGWRCDDDRIATEVWRADCKRRRNGEHQHVRFKYGA